MLSIVTRSFICSDFRIGLRLQHQFLSVNTVTASDAAFAQLKEQNTEQQQKEKMWDSNHQVRTTAAFLAVCATMITGTLFLARLPTRRELKQEIREVRQELKHEIQSLGRKIDNLSNHLLQTEFNNRLIEREEMLALRKENEKLRKQPA